MPLTNLTEVDSYTPTCKAPQDGDKIDAVTVSTGFQSLANRTHHHNLHGIFDTTKDGGTGYENDLDLKMADGTVCTFDTIIHLNNSTETYGAGSFIQHNGTTTVVGTVSQLAGYRERLKPVWHSAVADTTISPANGRIHYLPAIASNRVRTVPTTGIGDGEWLIIKRMRPDGAVGSFTETINSESGQTLFIFGNGRMGNVRLDYDATSGDWVPGPYNSVAGGSLAGTGLYGN